MKKIKIGYLGPDYTFTHIAVLKTSKKMQPKPVLKPKLSVHEVCDAIEKRKLDMGVVAIYNRMKGLVPETMDEIYSKKLHVNSRTRVPIEFHIGVQPGAKLGDTKIIYSHHKALSQCTDALSTYQIYDRRTAESTAAACKLVSKLKAEKAKITGAIASKQAIENNGLEILISGVGNESSLDNYTDFYVVSRQKKIPKKQHKKEYITLIAITPVFDRPNLLNGISGTFGNLGINLLDIHSRPSLASKAFGSKMFYLEMAAHPDDEIFKTAMQYLDMFLKVDKEKAGITNKKETSRILGAYEKI